jgi:basic membrane protein A
MNRLGIAFLISIVLFFSCKKSPQTESPTKIGLVFDVGGRGDKSFNDAAYRGLEKAGNELGIKYEYIEPGPGAEREAALRQFSARPDIGLILGIGFIFTDEITNIANEFPDKKFACVDYTITPGKPIPQNLIPLVFKEEEGCFLVGAIAGLTTKTNVVGFVGGMESPLIRKFEVSFKAGIQHVNPVCKVLVGYAGVTGEAFKNPGKGKEIALGLYSRDADIVFHASGVTGLGVFEAAREMKRLAIGVDSDQYPEAPGFILTSMLKGVDVAVFETIKEFKDGKFSGGKPLVLSLSNRGIDYVYDDNNKNLITPEVHTRVEEIRNRIISNEIVIPTK